jgi:hypothetical protein
MSKVVTVMYLQDAEEDKPRKTVGFREVESQRNIFPL